MKMFYKKDNAFVEVYSFFEKNGSPLALIFSPSLHGNKGNGWMQVKPSQLIPEEYYDPSTTKGFMSKTRRNKIKKRLQLTSAIWTCSDGRKFTNIEDAITYEEKIMEGE